MTKDKSSTSIVIVLVLGLLFLLLTIDILGLSALGKSLLLYALAFIVGHGLDHLLLNTRQQDNSFVELLGIWALKTVIGMAALTLTVFFTRAMGLSDWFVLLPGALFGIALLFKSSPSLRGVYTGIRGTNRIHLSQLALILVILNLGLLLVGGMLVFDGGHYYFRDSLHPIYELAMGKSTEIAGLIRPDLSYAGKSVQFHMLGPTWVSIMDATLGIDPLVVIFRVLPIWQLLQGVILIAFIARRITGNDTAALLTPLAVLFISPFIVVPFNMGMPLLFTVPLYRRLVIHASSALGWPAVLALLIVLIPIIRHQANFRRMIAALLLVVYAFFAKAPFLAPLLAVIGIIGLLDLLRQHRWRLVLFASACAVAILPFLVLMGGAHSHNFWAFIPHHPHFAALVDILSAETSLGRQIAAWGLAFPIGILGNFGFLPVGIIGGWWLLRKTSARVGEENQNKPYAERRSLILIFGSAALALIFSSLGSEFTEYNHVYFATAYRWVGWLGLILMVAPLLEQRWFRVILVPLLIIIIIVNTALEVRHPLARIDSNKTLIQQPLTVRFQYRMIDLARKIMQQSPKISPRDRFPDDLYRALLDMRALPREAIILRGRHYEDLNWENRQFATEWWPWSGFFATAVSGRQFVLENYKYKGIVVQEDFLERVEDIFRFYWYCLDQTAEIRQVWDLPAGPYQQEGSERIKDLVLVQALTFKGDPSWYSGRKEHHALLQRIFPELIQAEISPEAKTAACQQILDKYGVTHIMFEHNERPHPKAAKALGLNLMMQRGSVAIYKVNATNENG
ncbi:MAG: hypothetical protein JSW54_11525 [Fidelibacterota bacterium]|nr:MAG: hypothetical protein JSW54_11525 [Candidatus Neomarinimicrobiota bacterium]